MKPYNLYILLAVLPYCFTVNAQTLNIKLEDQVKSTASVLYEEPAEISQDYSHFQNQAFSVVKDIYESQTSGLVAISTDAPTFREISKVASNSKSNYLHTETNTLFPYRIDGFERKQLISYTNNASKKDAIYQSASNKTTFTVSIFRSEEAAEGRLRETYLTGIKQVSKTKGKNYLPKPVMLKFNGIRYVCNGVQGMYVNDEQSFSLFGSFECGSWLLSVKIDSEELSEADFIDLYEKLIRYFNPSRLTAVNPMNVKPNIDFDREALKDTVVTGALFASAVKKSEWAMGNVSERERASGFPDIYLNMHLESLKEYLSVLGRKKNRSKNPENAFFYTDLKSINDAGYLAEFIIETYENVIIVPPYQKVDISGYYRWKRERELQVDLLKKRYKINYRALPY